MRAAGCRTTVGIHQHVNLCDEIIVKWQTNKRPQNSNLNWTWTYVFVLEISYYLKTPYCFNTWLELWTLIAVSVVNLIRRVTHCFSFSSCCFIFFIRPISHNPIITILCLCWVLFLVLADKEFSRQMFRSSHIITNSNQYNQIEILCIERLFWKGEGCPEVLQLVILQ